MVEVPVDAEAEATPFSIAGNIDGERIASADTDTEADQWLSHGRTYSEQRFSPLKKIDRNTVAGLGLAWSYDLESTRGVEATPIVVDGVMYVSAPWSKVHALDAATGKKIWSFDPEVPPDTAHKACCDIVNRGVAVWKGSVFVATLDGRLVSIDAKNGRMNWSVQTVDTKRPYTITGAPRVVKDFVFIGNGGAEFGVRGYITAYHAQTGEQAWRFYTVPGNPAEPFEHSELERAAKTWTGKWWEVGGGGTAWDAMAYDPDLDLLYVGTGNGSPWTRYARSPGGGDNLYLSSILALRPATGNLVWHYQVNPGDNWDYTATQPIILADLEIEGELRKVLMQAPKNGFFYVLDRETGGLISARPYVSVNWASKIDPKTGRPVETEIANYEKEARKISPAPQGAHSWHPMAFSPETGLVYVPARELQAWFINDPKFPGARPGEWALGTDVDRVIDKTLDSPPEPSGFILGWDPIAQREVWRVEHEDFWNGGVLATAGGLVFSGTGAGRIAAYDAENGRTLWEVHSQTGVIAAPVSYEIDDEQYIAVAAGFGGGVIAAGRVENAIINRYHNEGRILAFKLGGTEIMPQNQSRDQTVPAPPPVMISAEQLTQGKSLYNRFCMQCHGFAAASSWLTPDLRYLSPERHAAFQAIVRGGILSGKGMPRFEDLLSSEQADLIHEYVNSEAQKLYDSESKPSG